MELDFHYAQSRRVATRGESTHFLVYLLLSCAVTQAIDEFVLELGLKESNSEKRRKLTSLALNEDEWARVRLFCHVLQVRTLSCALTLLMHGFIQHANNAQQAFSSSSTPSLQNALPALERMHAAWEKASSKDRYSHFVPALNAGMAKLNQYYQRSAALDAHIMAMGKCSSFSHLQN